MTVMKIVMSTNDDDCAISAKTYLGKQVFGHFICMLGSFNMLTWQLFIQNQYVIIKLRNQRQLPAEHIIT